MNAPLRRRLDRAEAAAAGLPPARISDEDDAALIALLARMRARPDAELGSAEDLADQAEGERLLTKYGHLLTKYGHLLDADVEPIT